MNVLVLEAGGGCGISTIQIIKESMPNVKVIATDCDKYARGLFLADKKFILPRVSENNYSKNLIDLCKKEEIDIIMPTFENGFDKMQTLNLPFTTDFRSAILCKDKLKFSIFAREKEINVPKTGLLSQTELKPPFFVKPRFGAGGRNIGIVRKEEDKKFFLNQGIEFIAQELIEGEPWNIDVLVKDGVFSTAVTRKDILVKAEESITVELINNNKLISVAKYVQKKLNIKSPFNIQGFLLNDKFFIYEINVRFAAGIIFAYMAGINFPENLINDSYSSKFIFKEGVYSKISLVKKLK